MLTQDEISERFGNSVRHKILTGVAGTVLRVTTQDRRYIIPAFQFTKSGMDVDPLVGAINLILGAKDNPWEVAKWWFSPSALLPGSGAPYEFVSGEFMDRSNILEFAFTKAESLSK